MTVPASPCNIAMDLPSNLDSQLNLVTVTKASLSGTDGCAFDSEATLLPSPFPPSMPCCHCYISPWLALPSGLASNFAVF